MYKPGSSAFDRALYLTLYNGERKIRHTTKKYDFEIKNPRLSIYAAGHTHKIIRMISEERDLTNCDGFISRFLIFCRQFVRTSPGKSHFFMKKKNPYL
jgi:hypothetical protein